VLGGKKPYGPGGKGDGMENELYRRTRETRCISETPTYHAYLEGVIVGTQSLHLRDIYLKRYDASPSDSRGKSIPNATDIVYH